MKYLGIQCARNINNKDTYFTIAYIKLNCPITIRGEIRVYWLPIRSYGQRVIKISLDVLFLHHGRYHIRWVFIWRKTGGLACLLYFRFVRYTGFTCTVFIFSVNLIIMFLILLYTLFNFCNYIYKILFEDGLIRVNWKWIWCPYLLLIFKYTSWINIGGYSIVIVHHS